MAWRWKRRRSDERVGMRDRRLQAIETVVQRKQRVLAERHRNGFFRQYFYKIIYNQ